MGLTLVGERDNRISETVLDTDSVKEKVKAGRGTRVCGVGAPERKPVSVTLGASGPP